MLLPLPVYIEGAVGWGLRSIQVSNLIALAAIILTRLREAEFSRPYAPPPPVDLRPNMSIPCSSASRVLDTPEDVEGWSYINTVVGR